MDKNLRFVLISDVRLVNDDKEWSYHRSIHGIYIGTESNMIKVLPDGMCQLFLQASEKIAIPFVYQTMNDENAKGLSESNQTIMLDEKTCLLRHSINVN
jgi:hypothetical protein